MDKGFFTPFSFVLFYVIFMVFTVTIMAGTGWTGIEGDELSQTTCTDTVTCIAQFITNCMALLTFQSSFELFNLFLFVGYFMVIVAVVSLLAGG